MKYITPNGRLFKPRSWPQSENAGLRRNLEPRSRLLALVFGAIHHPDHAPHYRNVDAPLSSDAFGRMRFFHVILEHGIENVVRRQRVAVSLIGTQFSRRRLLERGTRNHFATRVYVLTDPVDQRFRNVGNHREPAHHVSIESAVTHAQFTLVAGREYDGAELIGKRHQNHAAGAGLKILFGDIFLAPAENVPQRLPVRLVRLVDRKQFEADAEILGQSAGIVDGTLRRIWSRHTDADHILRTDRIGGDGRGER